MSAVADMSGDDLQDGLHQRRQAEPLWNLMPQDAKASRDRAAFVAIFAFAGDHQNKALAARVGRKNERDQLGVRFGERHAVQVDPPFRFDPALGQLAMGALVHLQGCLAQLDSNRRGNIVGAVGAGLLADTKHWDRRRLGQDRVADRGLGGRRGFVPHRSVVHGGGALGDQIPKRALFGRKLPFAPHRDYSPVATSCQLGSSLPITREKVQISFWRFISLRLPSTISPLASRTTEVSSP